MSHAAPKTLDPAIKAAVGMGDNSGAVPEDFRITVTPADDIAPYLHKTYAELKNRYDELMGSAAKMPATIDNDVDAGKAADLIKEMRLLDDRMDGARSIEKEPFQKGGAAVDGFFKFFLDPLKKKKQEIQAANTAYSNKKKDEAKRALEEAARKKREEGERLAREAAQAEERRLAAEEAQRAADAAAQEARENKDELEQGRLDAESALAQAKLDKAKARRDRDEEAFAAASARVEEWQGKLAKAKEDLRNARTAARLAAEEAKKKEEQLARAARETNTLTDDAARATGAADKMDRKIETATDGELARGRSELGTVHTLARRWTLDIVNPELARANAAMYIGLIDIEVIRVAIGKRMSAGNRDVPGVHYEQVSEGKSI